jgi:hypothetical protein
MSKPKTQGSRKPGSTLFTCHAREAREVFLAGTFNNWKAVAEPMKRQVNGPWQVELELAPGRYEYKFVVDGVWCCEPGQDDATVEGCVPNSFGTMNRVIEVAEEGTSQARSAAQ